MYSQTNTTSIITPKINYIIPEEVTLRICNGLNAVGSITIEKIKYTLIFVHDISANTVSPKIFACPYKVNPNELMSYYEWALDNI